MITNTMTMRFLRWSADVGSRCVRRRWSAQGDEFAAQIQGRYRKRSAAACGAALSADKSTRLEAAARQNTRMLALHEFDVATFRITLVAG
jgi:hypothetical protein